MKQKLLLIILTEKLGLLVTDLVRFQIEKKENIFGNELKKKKVVERLSI